eukprot:scaffold13469_cov37-Cyclotella_meneghiniana.AAC.4
MSAAVGQLTPSFLCNNSRWRRQTEKLLRLLECTLKFGYATDKRGIVNEIRSIGAELGVLKLPLNH